ncbi:MAG TPA: class I SAM-dependent methyltransferase [Chitinophagaceae bacterium]|nr:class I SAM-dependent methyltransferase [Chitinophagaceae bacterium]
MFRKFIASKFKKPTGLFGVFASNVMIKGNKRKYDQIVEDLGIQPHDKLFEIGYGPGTGINAIAALYPTCTIHGMDFSPLMYKRAGKYNKHYIENGRLLLQYGDFLKVPVIGNDYDKIFCLNVIYFWNDLKEPFEKVRFLLKNGGSFHIYMTDKKFLIEKKAPDSVFNKYDIVQVMENLKTAGFTNVEYHIENGYYIKATK